MMKRIVSWTILTYLWTVNQIYRTLLVGFAAFTFLGSVGFPVYTHICKEDGAFRSYFTKSTLHCSMDKEVSLPPCCAKKWAAYKGEKVKSNCCVEQTNLFKVRFDFKNDLDLSFDIICDDVSSNLLSKIKSFVASEEYQSAFLYRPPPLHYSGRELLIEHQVFRI